MEEGGDVEGVGERSQEHGELQPQDGHDGGRGPAEHGEDGVGGGQPNERAGGESCLRNVQ